ncbi:hypothetical protein OF83DRAFT_1129385 [Amylostereum chailletii]|nr:hypothetical protein OF83DRAFT_1129385 [Amylostereum chailletii]
MKVNVSQEELDGLHQATVRGAIEGVVGGLALSIPASLYAQRRIPAYRALPIQAKAFAVVLVVGPLFAIQTERRTVEFDEAHNWKGASVDLLAKRRSDKEASFERLSTVGRLRQWAIENQYKVILGSWAASMAVAGTLIMRDRHQSTSQKIVQARMWAQGLTIGILIGAGILTHSQREEAAKHHVVDHSWRDLVRHL